MADKESSMWFCSVCKKFTRFYKVVGRGWPGNTGPCGVCGTWHILDEYSEDVSEEVKQARKAG